MKSIILMGYMCAGKTIVGKTLGKALGRTFYDLDWYVEERFHRKVPQIFAEDGEAAFRDMERRMLHEVAEFEDIVLSCGGGTPCFFDNVDYMNGCGETVYLRATTDTLMSHIAMSRGDRPLLKDKSPEELRTFITDQLAVREPFYLKARHVIDIDVLDKATKVDDIVDQIREHLHL